MSEVKEKNWVFIVKLLVGVAILTGVITYFLYDGTPPNRDGEQKIQVDVFVLHYFCDKDNCTGEYVRVGKEYDKENSGYKHQCTKCNQIRYFDKTYPNLIYKDK